MSDLDFIKHRPNSSIHDVEITDCVSKNGKEEPCVLFTLEDNEGLTEFILTKSEVTELYVLLDRYESGEIIK